MVKESGRRRVEMEEKLLFRLGVVDELGVEKEGDALGTSRFTVGSWACAWGERLVESGATRGTP